MPALQFSAGGRGAFTFFDVVFAAGFVGFGVEGFVGRGWVRRGFPAASVFRHQGMFSPQRR